MKCNIPVADLERKLHDTVCRYKGEPVYVTTYRNQLNLSKLVDTSKVFITIKPSDPNFDIASLPLGYCQHRDRVYYITRSPDRRVKQGLDMRSVRLRRLHETERTPKGMVSPVSVVYQQGFVDMVMNSYPTLREALNRLRDSWRKDPEKVPYEIAISRSIALDINKMGIINVHYKNSFVGWMQPDKDTVHVPQNDMSWIISKYLAHELDWKVD